MKTIMTLRIIKYEMKPIREKTVLRFTVTVLLTSRTSIANIYSVDSIPNGKKITRGK